MSWDFKLISGMGKKFAARVSQDHALYVTNVQGDLPVVGSPSRLRFFRGELHDVGGTSIDMTVDGSVTPVEFEFVAKADYDVHIAAVVVLLADSAVTANKFGNENALTNGLDIQMTELGVTTDLLANVKTNGELLVQSGAATLFSGGSAAMVNEIANWSGNSDALVVNIPVGTFVQGGIRIGRGTPDRIFATVRDNLTGIEQMNIFLFGERAYEEGT